MMRKVLLVAVGAACMTAIVVGVWWGSRLLLAEPSSVGMSSCEGKTFDCYYHYLHQRTLSDGPTAALTDVKQAYSRDVYVRAQCHELVHVIGAAAVEKFRNLQDVLRYDDPMCQQGYRHGAEEALAQQH